MDFYAPDIQPIIGPVVMLPQKGSVSGGSKRPLNSYAILRGDRSILLDAPFSWTLDGAHALADDGFPPEIMVLSHRDLLSSGDAFEDYDRTFGAPVLLHPDDRDADAADDLGVPLRDPMAGEEARLLSEAGIETIHIPGHTPGSIMLYLRDEGGILLAGDSAVGPGPAQGDQTPRLERTLGADEDPRFIETWRRFVSARPVAAVLPLHGRPYVAADHADFAAIVANIWTGDPMDPRKT